MFIDCDIIILLAYLLLVGIEREKKLECYFRLGGLIYSIPFGGAA